MLHTTRSPRGHALRSVIFAVAALATLTVVQPQSAGAQSTSKGNPTSLRSGEIKGRAAYSIPSSGWAKTFYYDFEAGPGEVSVTVVTQPSDSGVRYNVSFEEGGRKLPSIGLIAPTAKDEREVSKSFTLSRLTRVLMIVRLSGRFDYKIKLDGVVAPDM